MASEAKDVGILAMDIYFPPSCVLQEELETHDGVSKGKYTIGLGQENMAFCTEVEDVISMRSCRKKQLRLKLFCLYVMPKDAVHEASEVQTDLKIE